MFEGAKYVTIGVQAEVGLDIQLIILGLIEELKKSDVPLDYLQVFKLEIVEDDSQEKIQKIIHSQEVPPYKGVHYFSVTKPFQGKLFAIDSGDYSTLMLDHEY